MIFGNFGVWQVVVILAIVLILFGVGKLPEVGRGLGKAIREFRTNVSTDDDSSDSNTSESSDAAAAKPSKAGAKSTAKTGKK